MLYYVTFGRVPIHQVADTDNSGLLYIAGSSVNQWWCYGDVVDMDQLVVDGDNNRCSYIAIDMHDGKTVPTPHKYHESIVKPHGCCSWHPVDPTSCAFRGRN